MLNPVEILLLSTSESFLTWCGSEGASIQVLPQISAASSKSCE